MPAAEAKGVRVQKVLDTGAISIPGDPVRLQQVVWNLLSNAIKFTPRGGRVQIRSERVNSHLEIVVSDTGQGISLTFCRTFSIVFDRPIRKPAGNMVAWDWDWQSCDTWSRCTEERSARIVKARARAQRSRYRCPSRRSIKSTRLAVECILVQEICCHRMMLLTVWMI